MPTLPGLVLLGLLGCGDPVAEAIASYQGQMAPLMAQNTSIANQYLALAKAVHKDHTPTDQVAVRISAEVVPAADALRDSIVRIHPSLDELDPVHAQAVSGWTLQAEAYREMTTAYARSDLAGFTEAQKKLSQAKVTIKNYVKEVNRLLEPYGWHLDEFPQVP
jgi:hypothetical protein